MQNADGHFTGYSLFCLLKEIHKNATWDKWPKFHANPRDESLVDENHLSISKIKEIYVEDMHFRYWLQYICDQQMRQVKEYSKLKGVFLKVIDNNFSLEGELSSDVGRSTFLGGKG
jgi:4-alpha-glucanotransferase